MTVQNAIRFIERGISDSDLRRRLNTAPDEAACRKVLEEEDLAFSDQEFDEAFHHRLTQCREAEEADQIQEFRTWWDLLRSILNPGACGRQCGGCC